MLTKKATTRNPLVLFLGAAFSTSLWLAGVGAQTIISPTPFFPLHDNTGSAADMREPDPAAAAESAEEAVLQKSFHVPLVFNESVERQIEYFTTRGRPIFQSWLDRSARYLPMMKKIFRDYRLPEDLVYVAMIESGFNPHAVSEKNAVGPWQFMRPTAREYGLNTDRWVDERRDPVKSTRAAAAHFRDLYNMFGSWTMALASYNAGMGRMQGAVLKARSDDFWELRTTSFIHIETQEYVPRYMAALIIAKDPVAYGFTEPEQKPFDYDEIIVKTSTDLRKIAEATGRPFREIRDLNPELLKPLTPETQYVLRVPPGTRGIYQLHMARVSLQERKFREERKKARSGGLLFSKLAASVPAEPPGRIARVSIVSPFAALLSFANILPGMARHSSPPHGFLH